MESPVATQAFRNISVPEDGSCLYWAVTFAYLAPVKYDNASFEERFKKLFGNENHSDMFEIQKRFQLYSIPLNTADIANIAKLNWLVTTKLRNRVITVMLSHREEFEDYITLSDILQSKNRGYVTKGILKERFCTQFEEEIRENVINVDSSTLCTFTESAMQLILSELDKVDQRKVKCFEFDTYLECMRDRKAWGGPHEIKALSRLLYCNIHVLSDCKQHCISCNKSRDQIYLLHKYQVHYEFFLVTAQALIEVMDDDKKEVAKNYIDIGIHNVNYKDYDGSTLLHFAAQLGSVEIIQALLSQGADIHAKNRFGHTPFDVAMHFEKKNAVNFFRELFSQPGSSLHSRIRKRLRYKGTNGTVKLLLSQAGDEIQENAVETSATEVKARFVEFVEYFVKEFESRLHYYYIEIKGGIQTSGKFSDAFADKIGMGILGGAGAAAGCSVGSPGLGATLGAAGREEIGRLLGGKVGTSHHENNGIKLSELVHYSQKEKVEFRKILVEEAFDIFQSFEMQFMRVTTEFGAKRAMHEFARDATNRALNYLQKNAGASISEAVIRGESKMQTVLGLPITSSRVKSRRLEVSYNYHSSKVKWNTASLYQKVGMVVREGKTVNFYKKKDGTSRSDKYGYRRLLSKEDWDKMKMKYDYDKAAKKANTQFTDYKYILSLNCSAEWSRSVLDLLNSKDPDQIEERTEENQGEVGNEILELSKVLTEHHLKLHEEDREKLVIVKDSLKSLKTEEYSTNFIQQFDDTFQELVLSFEKGQTESRELFEQIAEIHREQQKITQITEPIWFNVKDPVVLFTGRQEELELLHDTVLRSGDGEVHSKITWICGLGGIGKTELVRKYVCDYQKDRNVIWINAEKYETFVESFLDLARKRLGIPTEYPNGKEKKIKSVVMDIYRYLARGESLFVFDGAAGNDDLNRFLPLYDLKPIRPYILITSRYQERETGIYVVKLPELELEDALKLVRKGLTISEEDVSENEKILCLVKKFQCFPLAIQQAITYINEQREKRFSVSKYLEMYEEKARDLLAFKGFKGRLNSYNKNTYTTWKITTDVISSDENYGELALRILYFMAYIGPENVDRKIFLDLLGDDEEKVISAVQLLVRYSMINECEKESKQYILSIHTLVQEVIRLELRSRGREVYILRELLQLMKANLKTEDFDHAVSLWEHAVAYEELVKDFSDVPTIIVSELDNSLQSQKAYVFGKKAYLLLVEILGPDHLDTLSTLNGLAVALSRRGNFHEAFTIFLEVFRKRQELLGHNNPDTLTTMNHIASVHTKKCNYETALKVYHDVLDGRRQAIGPDHPDTLATMKGIAEVFLRQDDCEKALNIYQEVLDKQEKMYDHHNAAIFTTMNDMALVLQKQKRYEEALEIYQKVLSKRKEIFGLEHPDSLTTMKGMAEIYVHQGNYEGAVEYCRELFSAKIILRNILHFAEVVLISRKLLKTCIDNEKTKEANDVLACITEVYKKFHSQLHLGLGKPDEVVKEGLNLILHREILTVKNLQRYFDEVIHYFHNVAVLLNEDRYRELSVYQEIRDFSKDVNITNLLTEKPQDEQMMSLELNECSKDVKHINLLENYKTLLQELSQIVKCFETMSQKDRDVIEDLLKNLDPMKGIEGQLRSSFVFLDNCRQIGKIVGADHHYNILAINEVALLIRNVIEYLKSGFYIPSQ